MNDVAILLQLETCLILRTVEGLISNNIEFM